MLVDTTALIILPSVIGLLSVGHLTYTKLLPYDSAAAGQSQTGNVDRLARRDLADTTSVLRALRLLASLVLLLLAALQVLQGGSPGAWPFVAFAFYAYATWLCLASMRGSQPWKHTADTHVFCLFFACFLLDFYSVVYPLALVDGRTPTWPAVLHCISTLVGGVVIPLCLPGAPSSDPRKSASWFSYLTWGFLDPMVVHATRHRQVPDEKLLPLEERDDVEFLAERYFKRMDRTKPAESWDIAWNLISVFKWDFVAMFLNGIGNTLATFIAPIGIQQLLLYLEGGGHESPIRPWVWVVWIGISPMLRSLFGEWYVQNSARTLVRAEAIVVRLVFEHVLRMRASMSTSGRSEVVMPKTKSSDMTRQRMGMINNLVTGDAAAITKGVDWVQCVMAITQVIGSTVYLYLILGWSSLVGTAVLVVSLPVPIWVAKMRLSAQRRKMEASDHRVQNATRILNVLRTIKLFAWEEKALNKLFKFRNDEIARIRHNGILELIAYNANNILPLCNLLVTFGTYTLIMKGELTSSRVFTAISIFSILQAKLNQTAFLLPSMINAKVSLDRLTRFMKETRSIPGKVFQATSETIPSDIGVQSTYFTWHEMSSSEVQTDAREFKLTVEGTIRIRAKAMTAIVGPTGSGKTSFLMALGEMYCHPLGTDSWYNLPLEYGVAYATQETWVLNDTIRNNIIFDSAFDEARYHKVLEQCALIQDINSFPYGDLTEVGEKARVTLARAVYSSARILLLDDVFAGLDVHTARWVAEHCLKGDLVRDRTVILVTHDLALVKGSLDSVIQISDAGDAVQMQASAIDVSSFDGLVAGSQGHTEAEPQIASEYAETENSTGGKLIAEETTTYDAAGVRIIGFYLVNAGGPIFCAVIYLLVFAEVAVSLYQPFFLGRWAEQYNTRDPSSVPAEKYLGGFAVLLLAQLVLRTVKAALWLRGGLRASVNIHQKLMESVLYATFRWLDKTPIARVITRCTQDINSVDTSLPSIIMQELVMSTGIMLKLLAIFLVVKDAFLAGVVMLAMALVVGRGYIRVQAALKRKQSIAKSPVLSLFGTTCSGLTSIRAYGAQKRFTGELTRRINIYTRASRNFFNLNRWIDVRIDALGSVFSIAVAAAVLYTPAIRAGEAGFALSQVLAFSGDVFWFVRVWNVVEVECDLERIKDYIDIVSEPRHTPQGVPPAYWPASGSLRAQSLCARYDPDSNDVLHDISFDIKAGERVAVVGRTGNLALALLRAMLTRGKVYYDDIDIHQVNLDALRSHITIIPQNPELFADTLRENLDPFGEHDDATLNEALMDAGLVEREGFKENAGITLDSKVDEGGANFSLGQRQIIALARSKLRKNKLVIMDEDHARDITLQSSIRDSFGSDVTIFTIAHRLRTVMDYDTIMVMDAGNIVQCASPKELLEATEGIFREMVEKSHDRDLLFDLVK
ncbi:hypothetical protein PUNSTDRAFT_49017 [Punctularia strigosozonata HHB-11173 SS5]|uniref:uncharacterized protein n=1 Tax=Punctularia strigosozonata (strain HHB-11173) TaxID=741275 RepID=UPI00044173C2|nr:uncharacterized protein PUNSTDRAFT_49017 [Punctularia strigosozonata HHB-11173 SS5]EIN14192.1 hypothetical protein PUNSTDRAFT_49017 [Punctularia strigosozonata HHB-11173 SS5]